MKKLGIIALFAMLSFGLSADIVESDLYYVNVKVIRAFTHSKGYYIIYRTSGLGTAEAFIPYSWFKPGDKRAILKKASGRIEPYLSLYTKSGEFDHICVVLPIDNPKAGVWGTLRDPARYDASFDVESIEFEY